MNQDRYVVDTGTYCLAIRDGERGSAVAEWPGMARDGIPGVARETFEKYHRQANWVCEQLNELERRGNQQ